MWTILSPMLEMIRKTNSLKVQTQAWTGELFSLSAPESQDLQLNLITTGSQTSLEKCPLLVRKIDPADWKKGRGHKTKQGDSAKIMYWDSLWPVLHWVSWHICLSGPSWSLRHISWAGYHGHVMNGMVPGAGPHHQAAEPPLAVFDMSALAN